MHFEWDLNKAKNNFIKHKVSFEEAATIFYDPLAVMGANPDHSYREERMIKSGISSSGRLLVVSHTDRGDKIRIISARKAKRYERRIYEEE